MRCCSYPAENCPWGAYRHLLCVSPADLAAGDFDKMPPKARTSTAPKRLFFWSFGSGSKPNGYLFGDEKTLQKSSILKAKMGCSPGYRGFDPLPFGIFGVTTGGGLRIVSTDNLESTWMGRLVWCCLCRCKSAVGTCSQHQKVEVSPQDGTRSVIPWSKPPSS